MQRKPLLIACGAIAACMVGAYFWLNSAPPVNILFITLDTTRADRIGCYGYGPAQTPQLDALAQRGVLFERAYAPAPMTSPSHTSMFTGLWSPEHGVTTNGRDGLAEDIPTVAEALSQRGYSTAAFVAAFVLNSRFGLNRGFDVYDDNLSAEQTTTDQLHQSRDGREVIDSAVDWLTEHHQSHSSQPFFCWVHLYDAHDPYVEHRDEFGETFAGRPYDAEIAYTDRLVGRLFDLLKQQKIDDNTLIVVVGDHGESLGEHGEITHGYMLHDSTLRVPLIISDPRRPALPKKVATPVTLVDLFPTLLSAGGAKVPGDCSGQSLLPALNGTPLAPRTCYSRTEEPYLQAFWSPLQCITTERWRYVRTTKPELYDLSNDPQELVNLFATQPDQARELEKVLTVFESGLKMRSGTNVAISTEERRALESIGYAGGTSSPTNSPATDAASPLPDIKDMIGAFNQLDEATHLMGEEKFDAAAVILEPIARDVPNFLRARLNLGRCRMRQNNYEDAAHWFKSALEIDPHSDRAHDMLGFSYLKLGKLDLAAQHFTTLLEIQPESENARLFLGEIAQKSGDLQQAMRYYEEVLQINPGRTAARQALDALRAAQGQP